MSFGVIMPDSVPDYQDLERAAQAAQDAGFDTLFSPDHIMAPPNWMEGWTLLSALAMACPQLKVGSLVSPVSLHHPGQLAKRIATLDVITGGRVIVGMGAGDFAREFRAFGVPHISTFTERMDQMREWVEVLSRLCAADDQVHFGGTYYQLEGAMMPGMPIQRPHPPFWFGGDSGRLLELVAEYGQGWNTMKTVPENFRNRYQTLERMMDRRGRSVKDLTISMILKWVFDPDDYLKTTASLSLAETDQFKEWFAGFVTNAAEAREWIRDWTQLGVNTFILYAWPGHRLVDAIRIIQEEVFPWVPTLIAR